MASQSQSETSPLTDGGATADMGSTRPGPPELLERASSSAPSLRPLDTPATASRKRKWRKKLLYLVAAKQFLAAQRQRPRGWRAGSLALARSSWLNALLVLVLFLPVFPGAAARFTLGALALLPLATLLGDVTEKVAYHTSDTIGGLLNATFGNATEVIVSVFAMRLGLIDVVQSSLLGSVLSNMLLVLGTAFIAIGVTRKVATFNRLAASANTSLLLVAVLAITVPAVLVSSNEIAPQDMQTFSHVVAIFMLAVYGVYLFFQLSSHAYIFEDEEEEDKGVSPGRRASLGFPDVVLAAAHANRLPPFDGSQAELLDEDEDDDDYVLELRVAVAWLAGLTVAISLLSGVVCDAIEGAAEAWNVPPVFVGFVLLPIVGNAAEHATAIGMAYRGKLDLAIAVALGSSTQIALFVVPLMVVLGWITPSLDDNMTLDFRPYETAITMLSVLIVAFQVQVGEATYLTGVILVMCYCIVSVSYVFINRDGEPVEVVHRYLRGGD